MINYTKIDQSKLTRADKVCEFVKNRFKLSHLVISLNMSDENINVELLQKEAGIEVLLVLEQKLNEAFRCRYKVHRFPILSGSYMKNPLCKATVLYNFEKLQ